MSLVHRRASVCLTLLALALSSSLLLGMTRLRQGLEQSFSSVLSGADLIVATKGSPMEILLYSLFQMGFPSEPLPYPTYRDVSEHPEVAWTIPLALGDSHRSFRVLGTTADFLVHYRYGRNHAIELLRGHWFKERNQVVLGATVASQLGYSLGDSLILSHEGEGGISLHHHRDHPFQVAGILEPSGTPFDKVLFVSLDAIHDLHGEHTETHGAESQESMSRDQHIHKHHNDKHDHNHHAKTEPKPDNESQLNPDVAISSIIVKMKSRFAVFQMQDWVRNYADSPLTAILPALTLTDLWSRLGFIEKGLKAMSAFSIGIAFLVLLVSVLTSLQDRRREIAIYRSIGATPLFISLILFSEAMLLSCFGTLLGLSLSTLLIGLSQTWLTHNVYLQDIPILPSMSDASILLGAIVTGGLLALLPAVQAYRVTLHDGLTPQL
jgi:putative ABC transport system permease protein